MRSASSLRIHINGEPREVEDDTTLLQLVTSLSFKSERIAIELNGIVVRRADWDNTKLKTGDKVEIVHFVGGGRARC